MKRALRASALAAALALAAGAASADDGKRYTGTSCRAETAADDIGIWWGRAYNNSSVRRATVYCAVVREHLGVGDDWIAKANLNAVDNHPTQDVSCTLASVNPTVSNGGLMATWQTRSTSGSSPSSQRLVFAKMQGYPWEGHLLFCHLPPRYGGRASEITGYEVVED
jgi:hypothetical protein